MNLIKATIAIAAVITCCMGNEYPANAYTHTLVHEDGSATRCTTRNQTTKCYDLTPEYLKGIEAKVDSSEKSPNILQWAGRSKLRPRQMPSRRSQTLVNQRCDPLEAHFANGFRTTGFETTNDLRTDASARVDGLGDH